MPLTSIPLDSRLRDRLKAYGTAGMSYNDIIQRLLDERDRDAFIRDVIREADATTGWIDAEDL